MFCLAEHSLGEWFVRPELAVATSHSFRCFVFLRVVTHNDAMNQELKLLKREILDRLYLADFNAQYHDDLCRRYSKRDLVMRISLAIAAVVVFSCGRLLPQGSSLWQTLAGTITLISTTVVPLLKWSKLIPRIEAERLRWIQLKNEYKNLWTDAKTTGDWSTAKKELRKLRKKDSTAEQSGGIIPKHRDLLDKARNDVVMMHSSPA